MGKGHTYVSKSFNDQGIIEYDDIENKTWNTLINRQIKAIENRACPEYIEGIAKLQFEMDRIPQIRDLNKRLGAFMGWGVAPVQAVIKADEFFSLLANKKFPMATFIRIPEELDYLQEPDVFHEIFGHCPLLTHKAYATFVHEYGKLAHAAPKNLRKILFRLFWFTVEFGILKPDENFKAYGSGILSSPKETIYSVESNIPERKAFDPLVAMRTPFRIDIIQPIYFYLKSLDDLYKILDYDLIKLATQARELGDFPPSFEPHEIIGT
jgi:phenylalanine-4-hydroxylase